MKYFTLVLFVFLVLFLTKKYVDYSSTVYLIFIIPCLLVLILINLIILYLNDYSKYVRKKGTFKTTNIVVVALIMLAVIHFSTNFYMSNKSIFLSAAIVDDKTTLFLYKNKTFRLSKRWNHGNDNILGTYELENNKLRLNRDDLEDKTQFKITQEYTIITSDKIIRANKEGFRNLTIE